MIKIAGTLSNSLVNGDGMRYVIFFQGCPHHCESCHNKHTWDIEGGSTFGKDTLDSVVHSAMLNKSINKGVTISGGEPFYQPEGLLYLLKSLKDYDINVWVYTGYTFEWLYKTHREHLDYIDVLVDGKFIERLHEPNLKFKGSVNQRVIDVKHTLKDYEKYNDFVIELC